MIALVMAGGADAKWANHLGIRRHFAPVRGEPMIARTVRQLRERRVDEIWIVCPDLPEYAIDGIAGTLRPEYTAWGYEALNGAWRWSDTDRTLQVYGDVAFTDAAMDTICGFERRVFQVFGRHGPGGISPWGELFAVGFWPEHRSAWFRAIHKAIVLHEAGVIRRGGGWEGYRIMGGADGGAISRHRLYPDLFTEISDETDDIDTPDEYAKLVALWTR